jgi:hypothetical protein
MAQNLDLTLPATAPAAYLSQERETDNFTAALYTLVSLSDNELHDVARACETDAAVEEGDIVQLAPEPRFVSQSLRAIYDSHLELGAQGDFDPVHFIVVVDQDWKTSGVLLVTLENDDEPPAVSSFMCKPEGVGQAVQNLQIANMSWEDCEEMRKQMMRQKKMKRRKRSHPQMRKKDKAMTKAQRTRPRNLLTTISSPSISSTRRTLRP